MVGAAAAAAARDNAKLALHYLFEDINIFDVPSVTLQGRTYDANLPSHAFGMAGKGRGAGLGDALLNKAVVVFTTLNVFYRAYRDAVGNRTLDAKALAMAIAIDTGVRGAWEAFTADTQALKNVCDEHQLTEPFRRMSGFLTMMMGMVTPLVVPAEEEAKGAVEREKARLALARLLHHLRCNSNFYIQRFLDYVSGRTRNQAIIDFVNRVIDVADISADARPRQRSARSRPGSAGSRRVV